MGTLAPCSTKGLRYVKGASVVVGSQEQAVSELEHKVQPSWLVSSAVERRLAKLPEWA
jgi:hypothetical protein